MGRIDPMRAISNGLATTSDVSKSTSTVHRAVAELVAHHYGKAARDAIMKDVKKPGADDTREVMIDPDEIRALLDACDLEFGDMVALAMLLAVDQTPLTLITPLQ